MNDLLLLTRSVVDSFGGELADEDILFFVIFRQIVDVRRLFGW